MIDIPSAEIRSCGREVDGNSKVHRSWGGSSFDCRLNTGFQQIEQFALCVMLRKLFCQFAGPVTIGRTVKNLPSRATYYFRIRLVGSKVDAGAGPLYIRRYFFLVFG